MYEVKKKGENKLYRRGDNMIFYIEDIDIERYKICNTKGVCVGECTTPYADDIRHLLVVNGTVKKGDKVKLYWKQ